MIKTSLKSFLIIFALILFVINAKDSKKDPFSKPKTDGKSPPGIFNTEVPNHDFDIILGRPSKNSINISILSYKDIKGFIEYRDEKNNKFRTDEITFIKDKPEEILIKNLKADTKYYYIFFYKVDGTYNITSSAEYSFNTVRSSDSSFNFIVQADSHLDQNCDVNIYKKTLENAFLDNPDFLIDLGDTFMTNKYRDDFRDSLKQYIAQRYYFGLICSKAPLFLVLGNHDGESGGRIEGTLNQMTIWATEKRKTYYPNPFPDEFYTGNEILEKENGLPENYYAWEWGNSLFIVLDPYRYTLSKSDSPWNRTLGEKQYLWFKNTLEKSRSKFKFIFIHNLVGGVDKGGKARGGAEAAKFYEWGGLNDDGTSGFNKNRPGWSMPIHELFVKNKVTIVFHGHDHLFAKQDLDGIVYQECPQPGSKKYGDFKEGSEYGYIHGKILNGPGYLKISVTANSVKIDYIQTYINNEQNKKSAYFYEIENR